jgi:putative ABC transport system permease protein
MRWWQIRKRDADLERELRSDLELEEEEQRENGVSSEEARYAALRAFGNPALIRERAHEAWGWTPVERLLQDVRYGVRQLTRNPGFAVVSVMTLALGIAVNTSIFSAVSALLLRKPPVKDPNTLCAISSRNLLEGFDLAGVSAPDFESWRKQNDAFENMAAIEAGRSFTITGNDEPELVHGDRVTPGYFAVTGIMPALGRTFLPDEAQPGNDHVVILSTALWRTRYHGDPGVVGQDIEINDQPFKIIGVMPAHAGITSLSPPQLWTPLVFAPEDLSSGARANHFVDLVLGRLKPGVSLKQAQSEMDSIGRRLAQSYPTTNRDWGITVLTLQERNIRSENVRNAMLLLSTAVGLVLLIACTNIAGLLLTRGAGRAHELAIRSAIGASRGRLLRQMLTESLLIGIASAAAGLLLSLWGVQLLRAGFNFNEAGRQIGAGLRIDRPTMLYTLVISLLTTIVFGLVPAVRSSKAPPRDALSQNGRAGTGIAASRLRRVLVAVEVALALILLAAASVDMREVLRELHAPTGFNPQNLLVVNLDVSSRRYEHLDARIAFFEQVTEKLRSFPEVEAADLDSCVPLGCFYSTSFDLPGQAPQRSSMRPSADFFIVGSEYFRTMQIPLLRGRGISASDTSGNPIVAVVNQEFARRFFPNQDAIGKQIEVEDGNHQRAEIVGIVGNVNDSVGQLHLHPQIYESCLQIPVNAFSTMALVVRSRIPNATLAPIVRQALWSVDKGQPATIQTMNDLYNDNIGGDKLMLGLLAIFGGLAVLLAGIGIYGVIAYSIAQRTREIGIRVALGAKKRDVLRMVLREGGVLTGIGCVIGIVPALLLPKLLSGLLGGFALQGPFAAFAAAVMVAITSCLATYIPARRAMRLDPMQALRTE